MKTTFLAIAAFFAAFALTPTYAQNIGKMNPGDKLPVVEKALKDATSDGNTVFLNKVNGKNGLLVMFSCNTCPFVVKNQDITKKVMDFAVMHGVGVIVINSNEAKREGDDSYDAMHKYARAQHYNVPYVLDENSQIADMFGANHTPEIFLFNSSNTLVYKGAMNDNPGDPSSYKKMYVEDAINAMIAGKQIDPQTTKSIGCSIKRKA